MGLLCIVYKIALITPVFFITIIEIISQVKLSDSLIVEIKVFFNNKSNNLFTTFFMYTIYALTSNEQCILIHVCFFNAIYVERLYLN